MLAVERHFLALWWIALLGPLQAQDRRPADLGAGAQAAAGYAAKITATALFVSGRTLESVLDQELAPDTPLHALLHPLLEFDLDPEQRTVTARLGKVSATAVHVPGLGCVLLHGGDPRALTARALPVVFEPVDPEQLPWPRGERVDDAPWPADVDRAALDTAVANAFAERDGAPRIRTRAVVVVKDGRILAEHYAPGFHRRMPLPGWSMTKSVVDALLGVRTAQGHLDPDAPLPVPEWSESDDPRAALRLDHLLRMQSGLSWNEGYDDLDGDVARMLFRAPGAGDLAAGRDLASPPGTAFAYASSTTNLLCRILRTTFADDADYRAFPRRCLLLPVGARSFVLETDPSGTFVGSSFGCATARDWARIGMLYLQDGVFDGVRILPRGWVQATVTPALHSKGRYGRHWWLNAGTGGDTNQAWPRLPADLFYMSGFEGQYAVVFPSQRLVVVRLGCTKRSGFDVQEFLARIVTACGR